MEAFSCDLKARYSQLNYGAVEQLLERAEAAKVAVSRAADVSLIAKIPYKVRDIFQTALRRNLELTASFLVSFNRELFVPLFVTARAVLETGCLVQDVWGRVARVLKARDKAALVEFDEYLMKVLLGAKTKEWVGDAGQYQAPNVLTIIDRLTKEEHPGLRAFYDGLSEFAHPNFAGMHDAYCRIDERAHETRFVDRPFHKRREDLDIPVNAVAAGLDMSVLAVELYERDLLTFTQLCEEAIHDRGTWPDDLPYPRNPGDTRTPGTP